MKGVEKRDPGPSRRHERNIDWPAIVAEVKKSPNEPHAVGIFSPGQATYLRKGKLAALLPDGFDGDREGYVSAHWEVTARVVSQVPPRVEIFLVWKG